ncbi:UNVERIFIED_CONTAM: nitroreductase family protein, partial [Microbacterium sp. SLM126]
MSPPDDAAIVDRAITTRRSVRAFLDTPVPRETIEAILAVSSRAPSGTNTQPWKVYVLSGEAKARFCADVLAAYDMLVRHPEVDRNAIAVVGSSYGGYLAAVLCELRPIRWLAFRAPALYMDEGWEVPKRQLHRDQDLVAYRRKVVAADTNRALRACTNFKGDVLVVESQHDNIVPHTAVLSYVDACIQASSITYRVLKGADHGLTSEDSQRAFTRLLLGWLREMVTEARTGPAVP